MYSRTGLLVLSLFLYACAPEVPAPADPTEAPPKTVQNCRMTMGWDAWEPYHYRDIGGAVRGLDVELVTAIAREAGCELTFDQEDWSTLLSRMRDGSIQILSGASITPARENFARFSDSYRTESFRLFVRAGEAGKYVGTDLQELLDTGLSVGTTLEYVYGPEVDGLQDNPAYAGRFRGAAVGELNYDRLLNFQIDSFLEDPFVAATILRRKGLDDKIEAHPLVVTSGPVHLMFSKASVNADTVQQFNAALARLRTSGDYQRIVDRYL